MTAVYTAFGAVLKPVRSVVALCVWIGLTACHVPIIAFTFIHGFFVKTSLAVIVMNEAVCTHHKRRNQYMQKETSPASRASYFWVQDILYHSENFLKLASLNNSDNGAKGKYHIPVCIY